MKNNNFFSYLILLVTLPLIAFFVFPQSAESAIDNISSAGLNFTKDSLKDKKEYLELKALINFLKPTLKNSKSALDSAVIKVYQNDKRYATYYSNVKGKCSFTLPLDENSYKIEITKKGFVTKFIEINTKVNKGKKGEFIFPFEMDLFMQAFGLDISILKQPIAKIKYNALYNQFDYDFHYTNSINAELKKLHENYYFLQKIDKELDSIPSAKKER